MTDLFDGFLRKFMSVGDEVQPSTRQNELICIQLQENGWKAKGSEYVPGSNDIIVYWVKGDQEQSVRLAPSEQSRWIMAVKK